MKFHNRAKKNLFRFINDTISERSFSDIKEYILALRKYSSDTDYFDNVVDHIKPLEPQADNTLEDKYCDIGASLNIVAGLYYGDNLSLKHIERDYKPDLSREELKQEVKRFTHHLLFGIEESGLARVGDLQIEQEGLVPMMSRIETEVEGDLAQKHELMRHLQVYKLLSESSFKASAEATKDDPNLTLLRNTDANRGRAKPSVSSLAAEEQSSGEGASKESETGVPSFVEQCVSDKKTSKGKTVSFA